MRILLVTLFFLDRSYVGALRWQRLGKHLADMGWTIDVLTLGDSVRMGKAEDFGCTVPGAGRIATVPDPGWLRFEKLGWLIQGIPMARRMLLGGGYDLVLTSSPPTLSAHTVGFMAKVLYGIPWVADYRDYTVDAVIFHQVGQIRQKLLRWMEGHYLANADVVIGNTERAGQLFEQSGASGKVVVIPNGADPSEWEGLEPLRGSGKFRMVHAGRFVKGRTPEPFLEALAKVRDRRPELTAELVFSMVGPFSDRYNGSHDPNAASALADRFGVREMIEVIGPVDHSTALRYMLGADALVLFNIIGTSVPVIPAKLYEYLHMGKPVFAVHENTSEGGRILSASGMGLGVGSRDPAEIAEALEQFLVRCRETPSGAGWVRDEAVPASYHSRNLAKKLDHLVKQTLGKPSGG